MTDFIILIILFVNFLIGWMKGFLRSLVGPLALVACVYLSLDFFAKTQNSAAAIAIALFGPLVLSLIAGFLIRFFLGGVKPGKVSRFAGGFLYVLWIGAMIVISIVMVMLIPLQWKPFKVLQSGIRGSLTYKLVAPLMAAYLPKEKTPVSYGPPQTRQQKFEEIQSTEEYQDLMGDPRVRALLEDEELVAAIREKDIATMMNDPRLLEVMQDPDLLQKFLRFYRNVPVENLTPPSEEELPEIACVYNAECSALDCRGFEAAGDKFEGLCVEKVCHCVCRSCS